MPPTTNSLPADRRRRGVLSARQHPLSASSVIPTASCWLFFCGLMSPAHALTGSLFMTTGILILLADSVAEHAEFGLNVGYREDTCGNGVSASGNRRSIRS